MSTSKHNGSTSTHPRFVVVAGVDASSSAANVLATALTYVHYRPQAELHIVHVVGPVETSGATGLLEQGRDFLEDVAVQARNGCQGSVVTHLTLGTPWREILQVATHVQADLVVVGTHGRTGVERMVLGSQAELVVRRASCPVIVVRDKNYSAEDVPAIEPACDDCVRAQNDSAGMRLRCERHVKAHPRAHLHYEFPHSFGVGSSFIRPE